MCKTLYDIFEMCTINMMSVKNECRSGTTDDLSVVYAKAKGRPYSKCNVVCVACRTVSAPGKVLVAGGYAVLDRRYRGIVVTVSPRLHVTVRALSKRSLWNLTTGVRLILDAPQWGPQRQGVLIVYRSLPNERIHLADEIEKDRPIWPVNQYLDRAVDTTLNLLYASLKFRDVVKRLSQGLEISVMGDADFYTTPLDQVSVTGRLVGGGAGEVHTFFSNADDARAVDAVRIADEQKHGGDCPSLVGEPCTGANCFSRNDADAAETLSSGIAGKTGLGSSSAMIAALVAALLDHFGVVELERLADTSTAAIEHSARRCRDLVHRVAQHCNSQIQRHMCSGFDVAAAIYGSLVYRRCSGGILGESETWSMLESIEWDHEIDPIRLPPDTHLVLGDVRSGTKSPAMVSSVLRWKKEHPVEGNTHFFENRVPRVVLVAKYILIAARLSPLPPGDAMWQTIGRLVETIERLIRTTHRFHEIRHADYRVVIDRLASLIAPHQWTSVVWSNDEQTEIARVFIDLHDAFQLSRRSMRFMGIATDLPIEPPSQTRRADATLQVPGVMCAGVPGAGGHDAIFCIVLGAESHVARGRVLDFWASSKHRQVIGLSATESGQGLTLDSKCPTTHSTS